MNLYEASVDSATPEPAIINSRATETRAARLWIFGGNVLLLILFPPVCCPCGLGPVGFIAMPYMMLLGFPTIISPILIPGVQNQHPELFFTAYITNYVVMAYIIADFGSRWLKSQAVRKRRRIEARVGE